MGRWSAQLWRPHPVNIPSDCNPGDTDQQHHAEREDFFRDLKQLAHVEHPVGKALAHACFDGALLHRFEEVGPRQAFHLACQHVCEGKGLLQDGSSQPEPRQFTPRQSKPRQVMPSHALLHV